jgi:hypothetical protein
MYEFMHEVPFVASPGNGRAPCNFWSAITEFPQLSLHPTPLEGLVLQGFPALSDGGDSSDGTFPKSQEFTAQQIFSSGQSEF